MSSMPAPPQAPSNAQRFRTSFYLRGLLLLLALAGAALLAFQISRLSRYDINWHYAFYPAGRALLEGRNPYQVPDFYNPPWALALLAPLALLPTEIGRVLLALVSFLSFAYVAIRFKATPLALAAFIASPPVASVLRDTNLDGIMLLGLLLPPQAGLFFVLIKPQFGIPVALFWLVETWRGGRWRAVWKTFLPVSLVFALSLPVFGLWFTHVTRIIPVEANMSLFPYAVPLGLVLLGRAVRYRNLRLALPAGLLLSPYIAMPTWSAALLAIIRRERWVVAASLALWLYVAFWVLRGSV
jgi:hypothetical protein